ncbi:MAG: hypothetical protein WC488_05165 [Candidatus Micrarchaeia archaeon]
MKEEHAASIANFSCDDEELNEYLKKDALAYQKLHLGVTYILFTKAANKPISYMTLAMGSLKIPDKCEFTLRGKKLGDYAKMFPQQFPALLIGKLATDRNEEGKGAASLLLDYAAKIAIAARQQFGCSHLIAHAKATQKIVDWYKRRGLVTYVEDLTKRDSIPMYFELP